MSFFEFHSQRKSRMLVFYGLFAAMFLTLVIGLSWRQLIKTEDYLEQEERQSLRRILQPGPRGEIFDREGRLLVGNRPVFSAVVYLGELRFEFRKEYFKRVKAMRAAGAKVNREELQTAARVQVLQRYLDPINRILGRNVQVNPKELLQHFNQRLLLPMPVIKDISAEEYAKLTEQLPVGSPIQVIVDSARYYPYASTGAHALGYVAQTDEIPHSGVPGEHLKTFSFKGKTGKNGLEKSCNENLQGVTGGEIWLVDPVGFQYESLAKKVPEKGRPMISSLDLDLQRVADNALEGKVGAIVLLEVKTGEVLALASSPTFDLNELTPYIPTQVFEKINTQGGWMNRAIQGLYPPASPFKIITTIAGLRHGVVTPGEVYECGTGFQVGNRFFRENNSFGWGRISLERALAVSSNVYFYQLASKMGSEKIIEEARRFGLDQPTGINLPYETKHMMVPDEQWKMNHVGERWRGGDTANMSFGQGYLLVTPLQMACFAAALARNETRVKPTLLHDAQNTGKHPDSQPIGLSSKNYQVILDGMAESADTGSSRYIQVDGLSIAAKTGTGQILRKGKKAVTPWCVGFAPVENPEVAFAILIEGEDDTLWGSKAAAPLAQMLLSTYKDKYLNKDIETGSY